MRKTVLMMIVIAVVVCVAVAVGQDDKPWTNPGTAAGQEIVGPDGGTLVWVPAGSFRMGSEDGEPDEKPVHSVTVTRGFWLGRCEVTNAQYRVFCEAANRKFPADSKYGDNHPVMSLSYQDAVAYCSHYGLRLPTEAEWEFAARGPDGRTYPWGNAWDVKRCWNMRNPGVSGMAPVGALPEGGSWCGGLDMAGNVWEWCADWYEADYYSKSPSSDPQGPEDTQVEAVIIYGATGVVGLSNVRAAHVVRGGAWNPGDSKTLRCANRQRILIPMDVKEPVDFGFIGFRCCRTPASSAGY